MEKQELLKILSVQANNQELRELIAAIMHKLCIFSINFLLFPDQHLVPPELDTELNRLKAQMKIDGVSQKILLQAISEFYFSNVECLWRQTNE